MKKVIGVLVGLFVAAAVAVAACAWTGLANWLLDLVGLPRWGD